MYLLLITLVLRVLELFYWRTNAVIAIVAMTDLLSEHKLLIWLNKVIDSNGAFITSRWWQAKCVYMTLELWWLRSFHHAIKSSGFASPLLLDVAPHASVFLPGARVSSVSPACKTWNGPYGAFAQSRCIFVFVLRSRGTLCGRCDHKGWAVNEWHWLVSEKLRWR